MQKIMEHLFDEYNLGRDRYTAERHRIAMNKGALSKNFNKSQKKILLRITDDKDLIAEKWAIDSFSEGVKFGVIFMTEVFKDIE